MCFIFFFCVYVQNFDQKECLDFKHHGMFQIANQIQLMNRGLSFFEIVSTENVTQKKPKKNKKKKKENVQNNDF